MRGIVNRLLLGLGLLSLGLSGCTNDHQDQEVETMMQNSYPDAQAHCIGRFMVDIPPFLSLTGGGSRYFGVTIEHRRDTEERYQKRVNQEVYNREHIGAKDSPYYSDQDKLVKRLPLQNGEILVYGEYNFAVAYVHHNMSTWTLKNAYAQDYQAIADRIQFRPETSDRAVPDGKGYCIMSGFIDETSPTKNEWEDRYFNMKNNNDFMLSLNISNIGKQRQSLSELEQERDGLSAKLLSAGQIDYEKKAEPISLSFIEGEQSIVNLKSESGWNYNFVAQGQVSDPAHPFIQIRMTSGSMDKEDADKLWYSILGSLGPRPGAF